MNNYKNKVFCILLVFFTLLSVSATFAAIDISKVTSGSPDGYYRASEALTINVKFSSNAYVSGGSPRLKLNANTNCYASYAGGSGTNTLNFIYTVQTGDTTGGSDLNCSSTSALELNGAAIEDSTGTQATLTVPTASNGLSSNKTIYIDTTLPDFLSASIQGSGNEIIRLIFTEPINSDPEITAGLGVNDLILSFNANGGTASGITLDSVTKVNSTSSLTGDDTTVDIHISVGGSASGTETVTIKSASSGSVFDRAGNSIFATDTLVINLKDTSAPYILSVTSNSANDSYNVGDVINITANMSEIVNVNFTSGVPRILLETGTTNRFASYTSGTGSAFLTFQYTVQTGDFTTDLDYVDTLSFETNGSTIKDTLNQSVNTALPAPGTSSSISGSKNIKIDTIAPYIESSFIASDNSYVEIKFSEGVYGDSNSSLPLVPGDLQVLFSKNEASGGTATGVIISSLTTITNTALQGGETTLRAFITISGTASGKERIQIKVNSSSIYDSAANAMSNTETTDEFYLTNSDAPVIQSITASNSDGVYSLNSVISILITFSDSVYVTGQPRLRLALKDTQKHAAYSTGTGSSVLKFNYTIENGDFVEKLSYSSQTSLELNNGTIMGVGDIDANLILPAPGSPSSLSGTKNIGIDATGPVIDSFWLSSDNQFVHVVFSEPVYGDTNGSAALDKTDFNVDFTKNGGDATGVSVEALQTISGGALVGGETTIVFKLTYEGDDPDGNEYLNISPVSSTSIYDVNGMAAPSSTTTGKISLYPSSRVTVLSVTSPNANDIYSEGSVINIHVTFSESAIYASGDPRILLETGDVDRYAEYTSGNGSDTLVFSYTVQENDFSDDLDVLRDNAFYFPGSSKITKNWIIFTTSIINNFPLPGTPLSLSDSKDIKIDGRAPKVVNVTSDSADRTYIKDEVIDVKIEFDEIVIVDNKSGNSVPVLLLDVLGDGQEARYLSGTGSKILIFRYTVSLDDNSLDLDYTSTTALALHGGVIEDQAHNLATLTLPSPGSPGSLGYNKAIVIDTAAPKVLSVNSPTPDGTYGPGSVIDIEVTFNELVKITNGSPLLNLQTGSVNRNAVYISGSSSEVLLFQYTVEQGDSSADLDYTSSGALNSNGSVIADISENNADLSLPLPGAVNSLSNLKNIVIDGIKPEIISLDSPNDNKSYKAGSVISIELRFNENVNVTGSPKLLLETGGNDGTAIYDSGSGTQTLVFKYNVEQGHITSDLDIYSIDALTLEGGSINDPSGNNAILKLPGPGSASSLSSIKNIIIDTQAPEISTSVIDQPGRFITITFNEPIYTDSSATAPLLTSDFQIVFASNGGGLTNVSIASLSKPDDSALAGGETIIKLVIAFAGKPGGTETLYLKPPNGTAIYDKAGNTLDSAAVTSTFTFAAEVIYVNASASGNKTGISWTNAYDNLATALTNATENLEVWVKKGTYTPDNSSGNRQDTFVVKPKIKIYGGFAGTETKLEDRNINSNQSILSGEINTSELTDNSYHVVTAMTNSLIDGFTITGGYADGVDVQKRYGGGVYIEDATITLENCTITNNFAKLHGGGIYCQNSIPTFKKLVIKDCLSESQAGGLYTGNCYEGTIEQTVIYNCTSQRGGGIYLSYSPVTISNTLVTGNSASERGGGIYSAYYAPIFKSITVSQNTSPDGAGLFVQNNNPVIKGSIFWGNSTVQIKTLSSNPVISFSCIQGCGASGASWNSDYGTDSGGNIQDDPKLLSPALSEGSDRLFFTGDDGCRLTDTSPCINASTATDMPLVDITGSARDADAAPDMGAYEGTAESLAYVKKVIATSADKSYGVGTSININVEFSEAVTVTGTPQLRLNTGQIDAFAIYSSGTGTGILVFTYTVLANDASADLDYMSNSSLELNSGTIKEGADNASLTLPTPGDTLSLSGQSNIVLDTQALLISNSVLSGTNAYMDIIFSEPAYTNANGTGALVITDFSAVFLKNTGTATGCTIQSVTKTDNSVLAGGETTIRINLVVTGTPSGAETIKINPSGLDKIYDPAGNPMAVSQAAGPLNLTNPAAPAPQSLSITQGSGTYISGDTLTIALVFNNPVIVTGTPRLAMSTGQAQPGYAIYSGGSNTNTITFNYTVLSGDNASDFDYTSSASLELNGGSIASTGGIAASLILPLPGTAQSISGSGDIVIDTGSLTITSSTLDPANAFMDISFNKGVFTASNGAGALQVSDFSLTFVSNGGGVTQASMSGITNTSNGALVGGETTIRITLSYTGNPSGTETVKIGAATATSIFDSAGNSLALSQNTGTHNLNYAGTGNMPYILPAISDLCAEKNYPVRIDLTSNEHDIEDGISGATALKWHVTGLTDASVVGESSDDDILTFTPNNNFIGYNECQLILTDSAGNSTSQSIRIFWFKSASSQITIGNLTSNMTAYPGFPITDLTDNTTAFQQDFCAKVPGLTKSYIDIDLAKDTLISRISFFNDGQYGVKKVEVSASKSDAPGAYTVVGTHTGLDITAGSPRENIFHYHPFIASKIRLNLSEFNDSTWLQLNEIKIYGWNFQSKGSYQISSFVSLPEATDPNNTNKLNDGIITLNNDYKVNHLGSSVSITANLGADNSVFAFKIINDGLRGASRLVVEGALAASPTSFTYLGRFKNIPVTSGVPEEFFGAFPIGSYSHLKFTFDSFNDQTTFGINELVIYGETTSSAGDVVPISNSGALSSMSPWSGYGTDKLFDGQKIYNGDFAVMNNRQSLSLKIDLGFDAQFTMIRHFNDGNYGAKSVKIETAKDNDSANYTLLREITSMAILPDQPGQDVIALESPITARYIKFTYTAFNHPSWLQINEIEILGPEGQTGPTDSQALAISGITSSKIEFSGYEASKLHDNKKNYNNDFAVSASGTTELVVDLGTAVQFNAIKICNDGYYGARDVEILYSDTLDSEYTSLGVHANLSAQEAIPVDNLLTLTTITARYVKLRFNNYYNTSWFQLNEIAVMNITGESKIEHAVSSITSDFPFWPGFSPEKLIDNKVDFNNDFASQNNGSPVRLTIDLGTDQRINAITIVNDGQYGSPECLIKYSRHTTPDTYVTLGRYEDLNVSSGSPNSNPIDFTEITARFLKIEFYTFNDTSWFQMNEISIFGFPTLEGSNLEGSNLETPNLAAGQSITELKPITLNPIAKNDLYKTIMGLDSDDTINQDKSKKYLISTLYAPKETSKFYLLNSETELLHPGYTISEQKCYKLELSGPTALALQMISKKCFDTIISHESRIDQIPLFAASQIIVLNNRTKNKSSTKSIKNIKSTNKNALYIRFLKNMDFMNESFCFKSISPKTSDTENINSRLDSMILNSSAGNQPITAKQSVNSIACNQDCLLASSKLLNLLDRLDSPETINLKKAFEKLKTLCMELSTDRNATPDDRIRLLTIYNTITDSLKFNNCLSGPFEKMIPDSTQELISLILDLDNALYFNLSTHKWIDYEK